MRSGKTVSALKLLYVVEDMERVVLGKRLFQAYWVGRRYISNKDILIQVIEESGLRQVGKEDLQNPCAKEELRRATAEVAK